MKILNNRHLNKKGSDKILSVYWFVILFIVAAGIAYMVFAFYGKPYDVREIEANYLTNKVANCISENGLLVGDVLTQEFKDNFLTKCNLNFNVEDEYNWKQQGQYYTEIKINDFNTGTELFSTNAGNSDLKNFCGQDSGGASPFCLERSFYVIDKDNKQYQVNVISVVRKTDKNHA